MELACVLIDHLPVKVETRRDPTQVGRSVIVIDSNRKVYDYSPDLKDIAVGMPLQQALSHVDNATIQEADTPLYEGVFDEVMDALEQRSPVVESGGIGVAYVGLDGLEEMYGGEAKLIRALIQAVPGYLEPRTGVATGKFVAKVAAQCATPGSALRSPADTKAFLCLFAVDVLPLSWKVVARLHSFGLETLGQLAEMPVSAMQAQFGPEGRLMWELASEMDRSLLFPRRHEETVDELLSFSSPTVSVTAINLAVETLLGRAFNRPPLRGRYARLATLRGQVFQRQHWVQRVPFREPVGDKERALFAIKAKLDSHPVPGPLESLSITLSGLTGEGGKQASLLFDVRRKDQLRETIRQLGVFLGKKPPIYQVREVEPWSRLPERRMALVQYNP